jgi:hypothetical protein
VGVGETAIIPRRFCGPDDSANGGYACGVVASLLDGPAEVTLRSPPPLDRPLDVERTPGGVRVLANGQVVAEAKATAVATDAPPPPTLAEATAAAKRYLWWDKHPFPRCFVCGPKRTAGDGLCIYPGAVEGRAIAAAPFVPDATLVDESGHVRPEIVWASLDCPSWFGFNCFHEFEAPVLLGRLSARIDARPRVGDRCICVGWFVGREGRKIHCGSALYAEGGALLAAARATWIALQ